MTAENIESDPNASNRTKSDAYWKRDAENAARAANREFSKDPREVSRSLKARDKSVAMKTGRERAGTGRERNRQDREALNFLKNFKNRPIFKN